MRLTLRTLLAYLDREHLAKMLSAKEADALNELGEKISGHEFASSLVERIRSSVTRPRLGAPKLNGRGVGLDPNTVAEFLDNTLAQERMQEFEKVCLESDVHLAEVASCHQILSLVLAERPDLSPGLREKMHRLPQQKPESKDAALASANTRVNGDAAQHEAGSSRKSTTAKPAPAQQAAARRPGVDRKPHIPDYLRHSRRNSWKPWLVSAALVLLLLTVAMLAMGDLDESHPVLGSLLASRSDVGEVPGPMADGTPTSARSESLVEGATPQIPTEASEGTSATIASVETAGSTPINGNVIQDSDPTQQEAPLRREGEQREDEEDIDAERLAATDDLADGGEPVGDSRRDGVESDAQQADVASQVPPARPDPSRSEATSQDIRNGASPAVSRDGTDPFADLARALAGETESSADEPPRPMAADATDDTVATDEEAPATSSELREVGRLVTAERAHVIARWDNGRMGWYRLAPRAVLGSGERLLVFPSYRPQIALSSGIHMMLVGPAQADVGLADRSGTTEILLLEGRALLDTSGIAGSQLQVAFPGGSGTLTFESSDSAVALEVLPTVALGQDPGLQVPTMSCEIVATTGNLTWHDREGNAVSLKSGQVLMLSPSSPTVVHDAASPPTWIDAREQREIDLRASRELTQLVDTERPISLALFEQVGHRQIEVSALAIESLTLINEFDPLVQSLRSERHQAYWRTYVAALERAIQRGPKVADLVRAALGKQSPEEYEVLYRLLYGFNEQQLVNGGARDLVGWLRSRSMEVRILAFDNLRRITGRSYLYRPEREWNQQRKPLQDWENSLNRSEITHRSAN